MIAQGSELYIFKTNVTSQSAFSLIVQSLERIPGYKKSTIDLSDCDKVMRVECENSTLESIVSVVTSLGFQCEELED